MNSYFALVNHLLITFKRYFARGRVWARSHCLWHSVTGEPCALPKKWISSKLFFEKKNLRRYTQKLFKGTKALRYFPVTREKEIFSILFLRPYPNKPSEYCWNLIRSFFVLIWATITWLESWVISLRKQLETGNFWIRYFKYLGF